MKNPNAEMQLCVNGMCYKCLQKCSINMVGFLAMMRDERGPLYTREGADHDRKILTDVFLYGDKFSVRQKIFQFWWSRPDMVNNPILKHAMIEFMMWRLRGRWQLCQKNIHPGGVKEINLDDLHASKGEVPQGKERKLISTGKTKMVKAR